MKLISLIQFLFDVFPNLLAENQPSFTFPFAPRLERKSFLCSKAEQKDWEWKADEGALIKALKQIVLGNTFIVFRIVHRSFGEEIIH